MMFSLHEPIEIAGSIRLTQVEHEELVRPASEVVPNRAVMGFVSRLVDFAIIQKAVLDPVFSLHGEVQPPFSSVLARQEISGLRHPVNAQQLLMESNKGVVPLVGAAPHR